MSERVWVTAPSRRALVNHDAGVDGRCITLGIEFSPGLTSLHWAAVAKVSLEELELTRGRFPLVAEMERRMRRR